MSGHSKWANIRHRKQAVDAKKSQQFHKVAQEIQKALVFGNNPNTNSQLRTALAKARAVNLPKKTITKLLENKNADPNHDHLFWLGCRFAKTVLLLLQIDSPRQKLVTNEVEKLASKLKGLEVLPLSAIMYHFIQVVAFSFVNLSESLLQSIINQFVVYDFVSVDNQTTIYFTETSSIKTFRLFLQEKQISDFASEQTYLPKIRVKIDKNVETELNQCKKLVLMQFNCQQIVDNVQR